MDTMNSFDSNLRWIESTLDLNQVLIEFQYELVLFVDKVSIFMDSLEMNSTVRDLVYIQEMLKCVVAYF